MLRRREGDRHAADGQPRHRIVLLQIERRLPERLMWLSLPVKGVAEHLHPFTSARRQPDRNPPAGTARPIDQAIAIRHEVQNVVRVAMGDDDRVQRRVVDVLA